MYVSRIRMFTAFRREEMSESLLNAFINCRIDSAHVPLAPRNFDSQDGKAALIWAAEAGHAECALLLLDTGVSMCANDDVRV